MRPLSILHRWTGGVIGLLLAVIGLSGAVLVWEGEWITLPHAADPVVEDAERIAAVVEETGPGLARITLASDEIGLHQLVYRDGSGAYVSQAGEVVDRWSSMWGRPELWLFDLHHYLFAGETGKFVTGCLGIAGLLFVISGLILWWRGNRRVKVRLWPERLAPGPIVKHHRDLGLLVSPILFLSLVTGTMMVFPSVQQALVGEEKRPAAESRTSALDVRTMLRMAKDRFPDAALRRITLPADAGQPVAIRMRQPFEWTPNGRTQLLFAPDGTLRIEDSALANRSAAVGEKAYPVHSAKVGGLAWKLLMTLSGVSLALLGGLAVWSFWFRKASKRRRSARRALTVRGHPIAGRANV